MSLHRSECGAGNTTRLSQSRLESSAASLGSGGRRPCLLSVTYLKPCSELSELFLNTALLCLESLMHAILSFSSSLLFKGCVVGKVEIYGVEGIRRPVVKSLNVALGSCVTVDGSVSLSEFCFSHLEDGDMNCWVTSRIGLLKGSDKIVTHRTCGNIRTHSNRRYLIVCDPCVSVPSHFSNSSRATTSSSTFASLPIINWLKEDSMSRRCDSQLRFLLSSNLGQ